MKIVTVILARAGSKRIPKKNIALLNGVPLIEYTLRDAVALGFTVYLYTDMPEIRAVASIYPIEVRAKLFENDDGVHETGKELAEYNKEIQAEHIIFLQPTSPLRDVLLMKEWVKQYLDGGYSIGLAAKVLKPAFYYDEECGALNFADEYRDYNSHGKSIIYRETGSFYIFKVAQIQENHFSNSKARIIFPDPYDNDIDNLKDLLEAEK
jgi:CMP-N,N'-diacetyllegionaminic acid synthase